MYDYTWGSGHAVPANLPGEHDHRHNWIINPSFIYYILHFFFFFFDVKIELIVVKDFAPNPLEYISMLILYFFYFLFFSIKNKFVKKFFWSQ